MDENLLKAGDVVKLKSGSPRMTIQWMNSSEGTARCIWYSETEDKIKFEDVLLIILQKSS